MIKGLIELGNIAADAAKTKADGAELRGRNLDISEEELGRMYTAFSELSSWQSIFVSRAVESRLDMANLALRLAGGFLDPEKRKLIEFQKAQFGELAATLKEAGAQNLDPQKLYGLYLQRVEAALDSE